MSIRNYTSKVPVVQTISRIEVILANAGASGVAKEFGENGTIRSVTFQIEVSGKNVSIKIPANVRQVFEVLKREVGGSDQRVFEQAERTAWKLMQDWIEIQCALIRMKQADVMQVFLPYVWDGNRDFYTALKATNFKALLPAPENK